MFLSRLELEHETQISINDIMKFVLNALDKVMEDRKWTRN